MVLPKPLFEIMVQSHGFLGLYDFPNTLCVSPNAQVVHGIPNDKPLENGDIVSIDCGALKNGYYGDHAYTFEVGEVDKENPAVTRCYQGVIVYWHYTILCRQSCRRCWSCHTAICGVLWLWGCSRVGRTWSRKNHA